MDSNDRSENEEGAAADSSASDAVTLEVKFFVPGSGPKRVDVDGQAMERTGPDTFSAEVAPGGHALDWAARGQSETDYSIAISQPGSAAWMRWSRTDDAGRAEGHTTFFVGLREDGTLDEDFVSDAGTGLALKNLESRTEPVAVEVTLVVPGAGPKRVDVDLRAIPRTGDDTFATRANPGPHEMDWTAQGQPNTEYSVAMSVGGQEVFKRKSKTDGRGRAAGHKEFTI
jgi:hypothetical protein